MILSLAARLPRRLLVPATRLTHHQQPPRPRRFPDSPLSIRQEAPPLLQGSNTQNLGDITRHGQGDACITLSVGGTEFHTLRSTINANAVLADHVARAEANNEVQHNGAVFIGRHPVQFHFVLQHVRNRVESLTYTSHRNYLSSKNTESSLRLPKDLNTLRALYVETTYFRIPELQEALCQQNMVVAVTGIFGGGNSFLTASKTMSRLRAGLVAFGGSTMLTSAQQEYDTLLNVIGLQKNGQSTKVEVSPS